MSTATFIFCLTCNIFNKLEDLIQNQNGIRLGVCFPNFDIISDQPYFFFFLVCVCVCVREREREREKSTLDFILLLCVDWRGKKAIAQNIFGLMLLLATKSLHGILCLDITNCCLRTLLIQGLYLLSVS